MVNTPQWTQSSKCLNAHALCALVPDEKVQPVAQHNASPYFQRKRVNSLHICFKISLRIQVLREEEG